MSNPLAFIIEDDPTLITIFTQALKAANYEVVSVSDGQEAMVMLQEIVPSIILLDLHLPGVSGIEILEFIQNQPTLANTRIMVASGDPSLNYLSEQVDLILQKPVSFHQLRILSERFHPDYSKKD